MQTQKSIDEKVTVQQILKINPFAESVQRLHQDNLRVAEVCYRMSAARVDEYNMQKQQYLSELGSKQDKIKQISRLQQDKRKRVQNKRIQHIKNEVNPNQLRLTDTYKKQLVQNKKNKPSQKLKFTNLITDYISQNKRQKQKDQLQRSINLLAQHQYKIQKANFRRTEITNYIKQAIKQSNKSVLAAQQSNRSQDTLRQQKCFNKIIKKWQTADRFYTERTQTAKKKGDELNKKRNRLHQQHQNKHTSLDQQREINNQKDTLRYRTKIDDANKQRQRQLINLSYSISNHRRLKQERISCNKLSIWQQQQNRAAAYQQKHCRSHLYLMELKKQKQLMRSRNLHELTMTLRH